MFFNENFVQKKTRHRSTETTMSNVRQRASLATPHVKLSGKIRLDNCLYEVFPKVSAQGI